MLFARDGCRVPGRVIAAAAVLAVLPAVVWPGLRLDPLPFGWVGLGRIERTVLWDVVWGAAPRATAWGLPLTLSWRGPLDAAVSALLGALAAWPAARLLPAGVRATAAGPLTFAGAAAAGFFAPAVAAVGIGAGLTGWAAGRRLFSPVTGVSVAVLAAVLTWRAWAGWTDGRPWLPFAVLLAGWAAISVARVTGQAATDSVPDETGSEETGGAD